MQMRELLKEVILFLKEQKGHTIENFALIGGLALSAWIEPRATKDIDFLIKISTPLDEGVTGFKRAIKDRFKEDVLEIKDIMNNMWVLRLEMNFRIDFLITLLKWQDDLVDLSEMETVFGIETPVATPEALIVLKLKAWGLQDRVDIVQLYPFADKNLLSELAKRARVDRKLKKLLKELANEI